MSLLGSLSPFLEDENQFVSFWLWHASREPAGSKLSASALDALSILHINPEGDLFSGN